jgi:hypothetical protein
MTGELTVHSAHTEENLDIYTSLLEEVVQG